MKKYILFIAVMLLALSAVTGAVMAASEYTTLTVIPAQRSITHEMELTDSDTLGYTITYHFVAGDPKVQQPENTSAEGFVEGKPTFSDVTYSPADNCTGGNTNNCFSPSTQVSKKVTIDWSNVKFYEPGFYYWEITKTYDKSTDAPFDPSNDGEDSLYLFAFVTDDGNGLKFNSMILSRDTVITADSKTNLHDTYPAKTIPLSVKKIVTGNQGSKDQYFLFNIYITTAGGANKEYVIRGYDLADVVNQSPYNSNAAQPDTVSPGTFSLEGSVRTNIQVWLKDGQVFTIEGLPYNTKYEIEEPATTAAGYTTTYEVSGDTEGPGASGPSGEAVAGVTVTDTLLTKTTTVEITNSRQMDIPEGIVLESNAPIIGLMFATILIALYLSSKRKEESQE